jgi:hypothetical protein
MCIGPKMPKVQPVIPPPVYIAESVDSQVASEKARQRARAASSYGRQATILASAYGQTGSAPTGQQKMATGS